MDRSGISIYRLMVRPQTAASTFDEATEAAYDKTFKFAAERGITILPYLYNFNGSTAYPYALATGPAGNAWETWVHQVVQRYGNNGSFWNDNPGLPYKPPPAWEVWNEPNFNHNSPGGLVQPDKYAKFLKRTSTAINDAQKVRTPGIGTQVLFGGLISVGDMGVNQFLIKAKEGATDVGFYFNGLSLHPYSFRNGVPGMKTIVEHARSQLNTTFSTNKSLWITEVGWNVGNDAGETQNWVTANEQANNLTASFNWIKSLPSAWNVPVIIWHLYRDTPTGELHWGNWTGVRGSDGSFRPAWYHLQGQTGVPAWPTHEWQPVDNLGGSTTSDPDISSRGLGTLNVFAKGSSGNLAHRWFNGSWSWWEDLGGSMISGPGAVSWNSSRIDVVARAANSTVTHPAWNGTSWNTDNLGGSITSDPDISSWGYGRLDVFARGASNELVHKAFEGGWHPWENFGKTLASGPGAVSWGPNRIDVVARGTDNSVMHWAWNGSSWVYDNLGGNITSDPDISSWGPGRLDIFARGGGNELVHKWYDGGWSGWESLGGPTLASGPSAVSWGPKRIDVVARASDNTISHWSYGLVLPP